MKAIIMAIALALLATSCDYGSFWQDLQEFKEQREQEEQQEEDEEEEEG